MAANTSPIFVDTPKMWVAQGATANTNRDGTGTIVDVVTGATDGTRIDRLIVKASVTTTAGMVRVYLYDGSNYRLIDEIVVSAITVGAAVASFQAERSRADGQPYALLKASDKLAFAPHNAENFVVTAVGGEY